MKRSLWFSLWWGCLMLAPIMGTSAWASEPLHVLFLRVEGGNVDKAKRSTLREAFIEKLKVYPDVVLLSLPEGDMTDAMIDLECLEIDAECFGKLAEANQADKVIFPELSKKGDLLLLRIQVVNKKAELLLDKEMEGESLDILALRADATIESIFGPPPAKPPTEEPLAEKPVAEKAQSPEKTEATMTTKAPDGELKVETGTDDALIFLGKDLVGVGETRLSLPPGAYVIRIQREGHEEQIRQVTVSSRSLTEESVSLVPIGLPGEAARLHEDEDASWKTWVPWAAAGAVLAAGVVTAVVLLLEPEARQGDLNFGMDPSRAWTDPVTRGGR